jgi:hypothetical protein
MTTARCEIIALVSVALIGLTLVRSTVARQASVEPESLVVKSGALQLRALLFRPRGSGPFPAVLFNHGSYISAAPMEPDTPAIIGQVFAKRGYALLFLFRQGIGLSIGQGTADGDLMENAQKTGGTEARNRVQLDLLDGEEQSEVTAALTGLAGETRHRPTTRGCRWPFVWRSTVAGAGRA